MPAGNAEAGSSGGLVAPDSASRLVRAEGDENLKRGVRFERRSDCMTARPSFALAIASVNRTGDDGFARGGRDSMPIGSATRASHGSEHAEAQARQRA